MATTLPLAALRSGISESRFRAMGSAAHVMTVGGRPSVIDDARRRIEELEHAWSRFRPDSELNRLNASSGDRVEVSDDLFVGVSRAMDAWEITGGSYDPSLLEALERVGYDRSFEFLERDGAMTREPGSGSVRTVEIDRATSTVRLVGGTRLDLGGIGKGLAADLVVTDLFKHGVDGALVNIGGDIRVAGSSPSPDGWVIEIDDPFARRGHGVIIALADGAVATSSRLEKRWVRDGRTVHHLIDPRNGEPLDTPIVTATAVGADGWWVEAMTKAIFVLGVDAGLDLVERSHGHALVVLEDGRSVVAGQWTEILA